MVHVYLLFTLAGNEVKSLVFPPNYFNVSGFVQTTIQILLMFHQGFQRHSSSPAKITEKNIIFTICALEDNLHKH